MRILIFGLGSIGKRHAKLLREHFSHEIFVFRSTRTGMGNEVGLREIYGWDEVKELKSEIAFVTNPTNMHIETALKCARLGMHLFIEKPLSHTMQGVDELERICREKNLTCYIAYCMRFHPVIRDIKERVKGKKILHVRAVVSSYLPNWRPATEHKKSYSANTAQGGGVLLDLSHEFDYLEYLFGTLQDLHGWFGRISDVTVDAEDVADVVMKTAQGIPINLHMNFMSRFEERKVIVDFEGGYIIGDIRNSCVETMENDKKTEKTFTTTRDEYFKEQLDYFFANLGNPDIMSNIRESSELLKKILVFKQSLNNG